MVSVGFGPHEVFGSNLMVRSAMDGIAQRFDGFPDRSPVLIPSGEVRKGILHPRKFPYDYGDGCTLVVSYRMQGMRFGS